LKPYSHIIFDLDGTFIDSAQGIYSALSIACRNVDGTSFSFNNLTIGPPIKNMLQEVANHYSKDQIIRAINIFREEYDNKLWEDFEPYPDVIDELKYFHELGLKLSIVTNKPSKPSKKILSKMGLSSIFNETACFNKQLHTSKTEVLSEVLIAQESSIMVGDTYADYQAAKENNIHFCYCKYGYGGSENYEITINKFYDLRNILLVN